METANFFAMQLDHSASDIDPERIVDELVYLNYAHNRRRSPHITPEQWRRVFGSKVSVLELRFQADQMLLSCGNRPTAINVQADDEDELVAASQWTNNGPGYGEE